MTLRFCKNSSTSELKRLSKVILWPVFVPSLTAMDIWLLKTWKQRRCSAQSVPMQFAFAAEKTGMATAPLVRAQLRKVSKALDRDRIESFSAQCVVQRFKRLRDATTWLASFANTNSATFAEEVLAGILVTLLLDLDVVHPSLEIWLQEDVSAVVWASFAFC